MSPESIRKLKDLCETMGTYRKRCRETLEKLAKEQEEKRKERQTEKRS